MANDLMAAANALRDSLVSDRRSIHQHPELANQEHQTAALVATRLRDLGIEHETGVFTTGVVGLIRGAKPGKTVLLRADMDALPIVEESDQPYVSQTHGVMHACGHDAHTAILLAVARMLQERSAEMPGNVKLMFQPAEEHGTIGGAKPMIDAGLLENPKVDAAFGLHQGALNFVGEIAVRPGPRSAAADSFTITVHGKGGHAAWPQGGVDPVMIAAQVLTALQTLVSREVDSADRVVLTVASIQAGSAFNVIPDFATMKGTVRTYSASLRNYVEQRLKEIAVGIAQTLRGTCDVDYERGYPALINHESGVEVVRAAVTDVLGPEALRDATPVMGAEDFAYLLERVPGAFLTLGVRNRHWASPKQGHNARFDLDEDALPIGAAVLAGTALRFLAQP